MPIVRQKGPMRWLVTGASGVLAAVFLAAIVHTPATSAVTASSAATVTATTSAASSTPAAASQTRLRTRAS